MTHKFTLTTEKIRVSFHFEQDRFVHEIFRRREDQWEEMLASSESEATENWPASPPLQEIHEHEQGACLLAVGGAGTSHWSASIEVVSPGTIRFDLACRLSQGYEFLGSNYRFSNKSEAVELTNGSFSADGLEVRPSDSTKLAMNSDKLTITPKVNEIVLPTTIRWKYEVISIQGVRSS